MSALTRPAATPHRTGRNPPATARRTTDSGAAPSAMRTPYSGSRLDTVKAVTP